MEMDQKKYWDQAAFEKEFTTPFQMEIFKKYVPEISRILDIGCGYGRVLNELWQEGFCKSCGIDFSSKMIAKGNVLYPHLDLQETEMPFAVEDNHFDAVILVAVLTCIVEDRAQKNLVDEIRRTLKPGGILYINDFLINEDERNKARYNTFEKKYKTYGVFELDEGALLRHHTKHHVLELTSDFKPIEFERVVYTTMNKNKSNGFYYLGRLSTLY